MRRLLATVMLGLMLLSVMVVGGVHKVLGGEHKVQRLGHRVSGRGELQKAVCVLLVGPVRQGRVHKVLGLGQMVPRGGRKRGAGLGSKGTQDAQGAWVVVGGAEGVEGGVRGKGWSAKREMSNVNRMTTFVLVIKFTSSVKSDKSVG